MLYARLAGVEHPKRNNRQTAPCAVRRGVLGARRVGRDWPHRGMQERVFQSVACASIVFSVYTLFLLGCSSALAVRHSVAPTNTHKQERNSNTNAQTRTSPTPTHTTINCNNLFRCTSSCAATLPAKGNPACSPTGGLHSRRAVARPRKCPAHTCVTTLSHAVAAERRSPNEAHCTLQAQSTMTSCPAVVSVAQAAKLGRSLLWLIL